MIVESIRLWKDDDSLEYEARSSFFMENVHNVEEYPYVQNFKNHPNKCFVTVKKLGSFIVAEDYDNFKNRWINFNKGNLLRFQSGTILQ